MSLHKHFTNNASGNMNKKQQQNKYKSIILDDLDVEMISPHFLQNKTLKRPLRQYEISLAKTNPNGVKNRGSYEYEKPEKQYPETVIFKKDEPKAEKRQSTLLSLIDGSSLDIKPAYKQKNYVQGSSNNFTSNNFAAEKDKNTILSAMIKKGIKPEIAVKIAILQPSEAKKVGPAESKLKEMMNKSQSNGKNQPTFSKQISKKQQKKKSDPSEIGEEIGQEFDQYGNQDFEKLSIAYESAVRESIAGESMIKQSIKESFAASSSKIKQSIREDIRQSLQQSSRSLRQEIIQEISASKGKSRGSIEEIYQQVFEQQSLSNSLSKSQNKFKKSVKLRQSDQLSQSASKSFRMKTNIAKSLKLAEQLTRKEKQTDYKIISDKKVLDSINNQKTNLQKIQKNIEALLNKQKKPLSTSQKNKDLYLNFKIEINKLLASDKFQSKLKKLVSFLSIGNDIIPNKSYVDELQDNILKKVLLEIGNVRSGKSQIDEAQRIKKQYQQKLTEQLRIQEVNLRAEMNQKMSEKDFQLKKMIAELEARMMNRTTQRVGFSKEDFMLNKSQHYEVESDYSIDSENISWKADLWELLPQYEKKKLYEKQTAQVTKFLADVMVNELKEEALERSLDISFEFPQQYNNIEISFEKKVKSQKTYEFQPKFQSSSFSKKQFDNKSQKTSEYLADLPKLPTKKSQFPENISKSKQEIQFKFEKTHKDEKIKPTIIKILADYKTIYLKKKQEVIKSLFKVLNSKDSKTQTYQYSSIQQISILSQKQFKKQHQMYIHAYEQELIMSLVNIYNKSLNKKQASIQEEMKKIYERLVVIAQVNVAEKCVERISLDVQNQADFNVEALTREAILKMELTPCPIQILASENYMDLKDKKEEKNIKNELVEHIIDILSHQFAKDFPKRKK